MKQRIVLITLAVLTIVGGWWLMQSPAPTTTHVDDPVTAECRDSFHRTYTHLSENDFVAQCVRDTNSLFSR